MKLASSMATLLRYSFASILLLLVLAAAADSSGTKPTKEDRPSWTTANAERYPWPMGTYIRDKAYFDSVQKTCEAVRSQGEVPAVDCWYTWENRKGDNFLLYSVRVQPSSAIKWHNLCHAIYDNVKKQCGRSADCNNVKPGCWCDREINGGTGSAKHDGVQFFFPTRHWTAGEDNMACVGAAIQEAVCGMEPAFKKGRCYKKLGSQLHPDE